jgi:hypothetical protein
VRLRRRRRLDHNVVADDHVCGGQKNGHVVEQHRRAVLEMKLANPIPPALQNDRPAALDMNIRIATFR